MASLWVESVPFLRDCHQLDPEADTLGVLNVKGRDALDPLCRDRLGQDAQTKCQAEQNGELVGRVHPVHIEAGIRLRKAQVLRPLQAGLIGLPSLLHLRQDEVAGPIHDPVHRIDSIRAQALPQSTQHGDGPPHAGLECDIGAVSFVAVIDLAAVVRE